MSRFPELVRELQRRDVRFVLIGVRGANYYAHEAMLVFTTQDHDLFLPRTPENLMHAWEACEALDLAISCGADPLDSPRDLWLAEQVVAQRALTRARGEEGLIVDLTLVMADLEFEPVWAQRRLFSDQGVEIPVARLSHIVASKATVGRPKDRLFLEAHKEELRGLLRDEAT